LKSIALTEIVTYCVVVPALQNGDKIIRKMWRQREPAKIEKGLCKMKSQRIIAGVITGFFAGNIWMNAVRKFAFVGYLAAGYRPGRALSSAKPVGSLVYLAILIWSIYRAARKYAHPVQAWSAGLTRPVMAFWHGASEML
jgi:hypothetical protein